MLKHAKKALLQFKESHNHLLLACSGGRDSTVLLHFLVHQGLKPAVAHCNFKLRGKEADEDEAFVKHLAGKLGLPFYTKSFNTANYADKNGISIQMAARELRYSWFDELMKKDGFQLLLTAHHFNDQLESFLINFGRGTGIAGLTGIEQGNRILRPFLQHTRQEINSYAKRHKLKWREDSSNKKTDYLRNRIRHKVIPELEACFPNFDKSAGDTLAHLRETQQAMHFLLEEKLQGSLHKSDMEETLDVSKHLEQPYWPTLVHYWLRHKGNFDWEALKKLDTTINGQNFSNETHDLTHNRGILILRKASKNQDHAFEINTETRHLEFPLRWESGHISAEAVEIKKEPHRAYLDAALLKFPLTLRKWREGDRFVPLGMKGFKKLSDFFTDQKFSAFDKERQWLLCSGTDIVWVVGHRIDERYKLSESTKTVYFVRLLK